MGSMNEFDLEAEYGASNREWRESGEEEVWDVVIADGLD
jgi:hypothetical protein